MASAVLIWLWVAPDGNVLCSIVGVTLGVATYVAFAWWLGVDELQIAIRRIVGRTVPA
jgi:hypothetical protein